MLSLSVAVPLSAAVWSMPLCRVLWFLSLNKLLSQKAREKEKRTHKKRKTMNIKEAPRAEGANLRTEIDANTQTICLVSA